MRDVSGFFGLTYANYHTLPRSLMEAMPPDWQQRFVELMDEMAEEFPNFEGDYMVKLRKNGRFIPDPLSAYRRPDLYAIERCRKA